MPDEGTTCKSAFVLTDFKYRVYELIISIEDKEKSKQNRVVMLDYTLAGFGLFTEDIPLKKLYGGV